MSRRFSMGRRRWLRTLLGLAAMMILASLVLPYDSTLRLGVRFNSQRALRHLQPARSLEAWVLGEEGEGGAIYEMGAGASIYDDIGVVLKTGYGTQHRVAAQIQALGLRPLDEDAHNMIVIGDFRGQINLTEAAGATAARVGARFGSGSRANRGRERGRAHADGSSSSSGYRSVAVHDVIAPVLNSGLLGARARSARGEKYRALTAAVERGDDVEAQRISRASGWELDAMKFIPGLQLAAEAMPGKAWYLLLDDDTYVVPASLRLLLRHLDAEVPLYVGNAVGDFRARFAHGGSAIVLSRGAVEQLTTRKTAPSAAAVAAAAYSDSITETWGDRLLAVTLQRVGIYLDERFTRLFNGQPPRATRISADRFCLPLVSFHHLGHPAEMAALAERLGRVGVGLGGGGGSGGNGAVERTKEEKAEAEAEAPPPQVTRRTPLVWGDLWALYGRPTVAALDRQPVRHGQDYVGAPGQDSSSASLRSVVVAGADSAEACRVACEGAKAAAVTTTMTMTEDERLSGYDSSSSSSSGAGRRLSGCLAWTWDAQAGTCTTSPWMVVGEDAEDGEQGKGGGQGFKAKEKASLLAKASGVNRALLQRLADHCSRRPGVSWAQRDGVYEFVNEWQE